MDNKSQKYKCLKEGWIPSPKIADKYGINLYQRNIIIT